ncbi:MAG: hypothetical protein AB8B72_01515 [Crocinitomicaceae bacterium]
MKLFLSKVHSEENGPNAKEGKHGIVYSSKEDIVRLSEFFNKVTEYLKTNEYCHMQFRDSFEGWNKEEHIDIEINVDERSDTK